ncbi:COesterase domain-containing protein [Aphelenchoides besseyi]|nr:COesterase domain-containing protein [Aphelenchoides besseyi]KAI6202013.1 COesterase domain-containing protein [Aphelenchoides besseyi]
MHLLAFISIGCLLIWNAAAERPILETDAGEFEGKTLDFDGTQVDVFYGVPFAGQPKRFEKPTDPKFVQRRSATVQPKACPQIARHVAYAKMMSEDCLYSNIFKPHERSPNSTGYPLLLFIHGGAYQGGSAMLHSLEYMAKHYTSRGLIYAPLQYRLGITGFASNGDDEFKGNYGLFDVKQALLWFRRNVNSLDIDLSRITLFGYSAGASIVGHMVLSKHTRDLFSQAIQMSGSSVNQWSFSNASVQTTKTVVRHLNCEKQSTAEIKQCLQQLSYDELHQAVLENEPENIGLNLNPFTPRFDNDFFDDDLPNLLGTKPMPTLSSLTQNEFLLFVLYDYFNTTFYLRPEERQNFGYEEMKELITNRFINVKDFGNDREEVVEKIMDFYTLKAKTVNHSTVDYVQVYGQFLSDVEIVVSQLLEFKKKTQLGWPIYHVLTVYNENLKRNYKHLNSDESTHACEFPFLFGVNFLGDTNFTSSDRKFRDALVDSIVQFTLHGSPNAPGQKKYAQATETEQFKYTELGTETQIKNSLFEDSVKFWNEISQRYKFDLIRGIPLQTNRKQSKVDL